MKFILSRGITKGCTHLLHRAHVASSVSGRFGVCPHCWQHHGFAAAGSNPLQRLADGLRKSLDEKSLDAKKPKSDEPGFGETNAKGERWITVHPHGKDEDGFPVKIKLNNDGSASIVGGAGGALNGLRMTGVKSEAEYKEMARQRQQEKAAAKKQKEQEQWNATVERHKASVAEEHKAQGKDVEENAVIAEAHNRAKAEKEQAEATRAAELEERTAAQRQAERELIAHAAAAQGWDESEYSLADEDLAGAREQLEADHLQSNAALREQLKQGTPVQQKKAREKLDELVQHDLERIQDAHHRQLYARAQEVFANHGEAILTAHDGLAQAKLGASAIGDFARDTLGDSGKGYQANLAEQAKERGMDLDAIDAQAEELRQQSRIERAGGNLDEAGKQAEAVRRRQEGAQQARERIERAQQKLGESGKHLDRLKELDTDPGAADVAASAEHLTTAKQIQDKIKAARKAVKEAKDADVLETLPKAAVLEAGKELTHAEAKQQVLHDLEERNRQRAMGHLIDLYNAQDALSPLRSHRLSGHNAFLGNLCHIAGENGVSLASPDPLVADILGPSAMAHVLRRAIERHGDETLAEGVQEAVKGEHIAQQVYLADEATGAARELLNQADNLNDFPLDSMDALLAGLERNQQRLELTRRGREHLGLALGRLEAAAAINEAFMADKPKDLVQVPLGGISLEEALTQAYAMGLSRPDRFDHIGNLAQAGEFHIHHDGHNAILQIHTSGLDRLADSLQEDPAHLERARVMSEIKAGKQDEANWLPEGISRRPRIDVSRDPVTDVPHYDKPLDFGDTGSGGGLFDAPGSPMTSEQIAKVLRDDIAERIETGVDPTAIVSHLWSVDVRKNQVPQHLEEAYLEALEAVIPAFKPPTGRKVTTQDQVDHKNATDEKLRGYHGAWLSEQVQAGKLSSEEESVHRQTLPQTNATRDLLHQVSIQDPRLQHAFGSVGELGREGYRAVREYAYEQLFKDKDGQPLNPKDKENPIQALSPAEHKAWLGWRQLAAAAKESGGDPYAAIQAHWKEQDEKESGGLFGDAPEPHDFATLDLNDDHAVIESARKHATSLGYTPERRVTDLRAAQYEDVVPELEVTGEQPQSEVAREARKRIHAALRDHAFEHMLGAPDLKGSHFNPANVATASERWAHYVADMGGEKRAYRAVMDKMKGDFAQRFAKGYRQLTGQEWKTVHIPISHADDHAVAALSPEKRREVEAQKRSEQARAMNREGGKFAEGGVKDRLEQQKEEQARAAALFGSDTGRSEQQHLETHRVTLGGAAEAMVRGLLPKVNLKKGTAAAGDIDMSSGDGIKRQRAIKQLEAARRVGWTLSTGSGKTLLSLAAHSHLKSQGKVKRSLFAVPVDVQENFGVEAARFYDVTHPATPQWFANSKATAAERRAAYKHDSGHDVCVVTHHALRDDLTWALAQHRFGGDEEQAKEYLASAPESERNEVVKQAVASQGWHFDLTGVDEQQVLLNREGKENSAMANAIDAFTHDKPYHIATSADPVKNDSSEAFSFLQKVAPHRYVVDNHPDAGKPGVVSQSEFLRKYGVNTPAAMRALQREMAPYHYAERIDPDAKKFERRHRVPLTDSQQQAYNEVLTAYQRARDARRRGEVDIEAVRQLSPGSFSDDPATHEATAQRLQQSAGILRDTALDRVVHLHPDGAKLQALDRLIQAKPPGEHPKIIFAHHREAVDMIHDRLKAQGVRVTKIDGGMNGAEREKRKLMFNPQWDEASGQYVTEPEADVIVCSDAAEAGWNGQRGTEVIHYDTPPTAKTYRQREGRAHRTGQRRDVTVHSLVTDTAHCRKRRELLERKDMMRDALTSPAGMLDDSGLALRIQQETETARQRLIEEKVNQSRELVKAA